MQDKDAGQGGGDSGMNAKWLSDQLRALFSANTHGAGEIINHWCYDEDCSQFVVRLQGRREFDVVVREREP